MQYQTESGRPYLFPERARKKLRQAEAGGMPVYIYGITGYGKTGLVEHYLKNKKYSYISCVGDDAGQKLCGLSENPHTAVSAGIIVIDDIQNADTEEKRDAITRLASGNGYWLVLAGRPGRPAWLVESDTMHLPFVFIGEEELSFTNSELAEYMELNGIQLDERSIEKIESVTYGMPYAISVLVQEIKRQGEPYRLTKETFPNTWRTLRDYANTQVLDKWDVHMREFFEALSIVPAFDTELARVLTGVRDIGRILRQANETGNFLTEKDGLYTMHFSTRRTMLSRIDADFSEEEIRRLYLSAGQYYLQKGRLKEALTAFQEGGDETEIVRVLKYNTRFEPGGDNLFSLKSFYLSIPGETVLESPELMAAISMIHSMLLQTETP